MFVYLSVLRVLFAFLMLTPVFAWAFGFSIVPIRVHVPFGERSAHITVRNQSSAVQRYQLYAKHWRQNKTGQDVYTDTKDLIFFPRLLEIPPKSSQLIRLGLNKPVIGKEETYRLYVKQLPDVKNKNIGLTKKHKGNVNILLSVGVPIFLEPKNKVNHGKLSKLTLKKGMLYGVVRNTGNVHWQSKSFKVTARDALGKSRWSEEIQMRYVLAQTAHAFKVKLPQKTCAQISKLDLVMHTYNDLSLYKDFNVEARQCH